ncbi:mannonate dehydratase [Natrialba taiwanensis]|uniref:mannonate dehydratase n=1 Tax=Natrialba taiwanensis TaxID=160846 RepID=UPI00373AEB90
MEPAAFERSLLLIDTTRLAKDGRDDEIDEFCQLLRNLGELDIDVVYYDWMAGLRWVRTSVTAPSRGDSLTTSYSDDQMRRRPACHSTLDDGRRTLGKSGLLPRACRSGRRGSGHQTWTAPRRFSHQRRSRDAAHYQLSGGV